MSVPPQSRRRSSSGEGRVLSRLHNLFGPSSPSASTASEHQGRDKDQGAAAASESPSKTGSEPGMSPDRSARGEGFVDRKGIKVFVATWNMGDALPKGDLSVLLGHVPPYVSSVPPQGDLPFLPLENAHPYHIVVVAGQECPTDSGVPRGLGGGIMKGMSIKRLGEGSRKDKSKDGREDKEKGKLAKVKEEVDHISEGIGYAADALSDALSETSSIEPGDDGMAEKRKERKGDGRLHEPVGVDDRSRSTSPNLLQPHTPHKHHNQSGKGWSTMLDDWLCGPTATHIVRSPSPSSPLPVPEPPGAGSADVLRSFSAPAHPSPHSEPATLSSSPIPFQRSESGGHLAVLSPPRALHHSPLDLAQSPASIHSTGSISSSSSDGVPLPDYMFPETPSIPKPSASMPLPEDPAAQKWDKPDLVLPPTGEENFSGRGGTGCYLHLVKERLMGMYLSVYVYKGCEHLVQGVDKDFVTTGLAGGRLGNKGGIGISLKVADHTFLFVNSHLAAHTGRQAARIANVAKIKSGLKLDCFLPSSDMRTKADDITERFDTTFWCGDLNFRLEMTRLHAEWLIEQKKYQEALSWDQLRNAMKSSDTAVNPFTGFEEGPIDFPPTFKYDVWRSLKHTNRELRKSIKRKPSDANSRSKPAGELSASLASSGGFLGGVPEMEDENEHPDDDTVSHRSFSSRYSATAPSAPGTDVEEGDSLDMDETAIANGQANSHRPIDIAVKQKAKHLLNLVRTGSNKVLGTSPGRRISLRRKKVDAGLNYSQQPVEYDSELRRDSVSTQASASPSLEGLSSFSPADEARIRTSPPMTIGSPVMPTSPPMPRRPSIAGSLQPVGRKFSALKRTVSGRSTRVDEEIIDGEMIEDSREGVYDTSKKQRVPSWCDRVLWKTHVTPDAQSHEGDQNSHRSSRPFNRLSHAFADFRGHLRQMTRSTTLEPPPSSPSRISSSSPSSAFKPLYAATSPVDIERQQSPASPGSALLVESPPNTGLAIDTTPSGLNPSPRRRPSDSTSPSQVRHPLLNRSGSHSSSPVQPRVNFDPASSAPTDRRSSAQDLSARRRANSLGSPGLDKSSETLTNGHPGVHRMISQETASTEDPMASDSTLSRAKTTDPRQFQPSVERAADRSLPLDRYRTEGHDVSQRRGSTDVEESRNAFKRFWRDLPHILGRNTTRDTPEDGAVQAADKDEDERQKRHDKGEVVCLHYGTIDDAGMRQLEGRSDHRPALFAAAVFI